MFKFEKKMSGMWISSVRNYTDIEQYAAGQLASMEISWIAINATGDTLKRWIDVCAIRDIAVGTYCNIEPNFNPYITETVNNNKDLGAAFNIYELDLRWNDHANFDLQRCAEDWKVALKEIKHFHQGVSVYPLLDEVKYIPYSKLRSSFDSVHPTMTWTTLKRGNYATYGTHLAYNWRKEEDCVHVLPTYGNELYKKYGELKEKDFDKALKAQGDRACSFYCLDNMKLEWLPAKIKKFAKR